VFRGAATQWARQQPLKQASATCTKRYTSSTNQKTEEPVTIYTGPLANVAKKLKLFSITSLGLGTGISPFVFAIDVPVPFVAKAALVGAGKTKKTR
jgi:hypothetical protein